VARVRRALRLKDCLPAILLVATCLTPLGAQAQNATWLAAPATSDFGTASNWTPAVVPTGTANFGTSNTTTVSLSSNPSLGGLQFNAGFSSYTLSGGSLTLGGAGIINNSSVGQSLNFNGTVLTLNNSASAGTGSMPGIPGAFISASGAGGIFLNNNSTAGNATITTSGVGTTIAFRDNSTAGAAFISVQSGATATLVDSASGGQAVFNTLSGSMLDISNLTTGGTTVGMISGGGNVVLGSKQLVVGGGGSAGFNGTISGTGSLVMGDVGGLTLLGANTYTGGTTVNAGVLELAAGGSLALTGALTVNGGTFQVTGGTQTVASLSGSGGTVDLRSSTLTVNQGASNFTYGGVISGSGTLVKQGAGTLVLAGPNTYSGGTTVNGGILQGTTPSLQGNIVNDASVVFNQNANGTYAGVMSGNGNLTKQGAGTVTLSGANTYGGGTTVSGGILQGSTTSLQGNIVNNAAVVFDQASTGTYAGSMSGTGSLTKQGAGTLILSGVNINSGGTTVSGGILQGNAASLQGAITNNAAVVFDQTGTGTYAGNMTGAGGLTKQGAGTTIMTGTNGYLGGTTVDSGTLQLGVSGGSTGTITGAVTMNNAIFNVVNADTSGIASITNNGGGTTFRGASTAGNAAITNNSFGSTQFFDTSTAGNATITTNDGGIMQFNGSSTADNATIINNPGSVAIFTQSSNGGQARFANNGLGLDFSTVTSGAVTAGSIEGLGRIFLGANQLTVGSNNLSTEVNGEILGSGGQLVKVGTGTLTLSGSNTYAGPTTVSAGTLTINGSINSSVTVGVAGTLGGSGTIFGGVVNNGAVAPGNSIGTLNVVGSYVQNGGVYQVEVDAAGQSDRINVTGPPGTATINGGAVQVLAQPGTYARNTTYTILSATGGRTGTYSNVTSNFAFLTPSLSYDANNVYLLLFQTNGAFAAGAQTGNQRAVGTVLDQANATATGDFNTVLNALSSLNTQQGPAALTAISGQQYSGFGSANMSSGLMFMNVLGQQMSLARGSSGGGTRVALAEACDVACDGAGPSPWSLWGSALGATGSVAGNNNSATLTYNAGGVSTGVDYRFSPNLLAGLGVGFASGNQWASGFNGRGTSDSYSGSLYGSFTQSAFYLDALAGYAYNDNQMTRQIVIPGLPTRTAMGRTGANQLLGQAEAGYKVWIYEPAAASLTPFARFQAMTVNQAAFSEAGASSLNLNVAQQTTNSVRTVLGAELAGGIDMGWREKLALQFRLGWAHEYADTSRPVTASFAGAPTLGYTVYGAAPQRDSATIGLAANTAIAEATSVYLRYDGELGTGIDNHVFSAGLRMTW